MSEEMVISPTGRGWDARLWIDGVNVSGLAVVDQFVRAGAARLKMAGIAGVWTSDQHRKKGYASRVMFAAVEEMGRRSYDVSILYGIPDFYHRYGYAVCFASPVCQVETDALPASIPVSRKVRAARRADIPAIAALHTRTNSDRSATTIRSRSWMPDHARRYGWRMPRLGGDTVRRAGRAIVVEGADGRISAYAVFDAQLGHCAVTEVGARDRSAYAAIARRVRQIARGTGAEQVRFHLPEEDPFGEYLNRFGCTWTIHHPYNSGAMGRVVSLEGTVRRILPTLEWRLSAGGSELPDTGLTLETDLGSVTVSKARGGLAVQSQSGGARCRLTQAALTQLLFGYRSVADLAISGEVRAAARWHPLLDTLFPVGHPYSWWADRF